MLTVVDLKTSCSFFDAMWNMTAMYITIELFNLPISKYNAFLAEMAD